MSTDQPNPALLAAARAYAEATWDYDGPYRTSRDRENHIGADAASTAERPWFAALWEAGIAEGRRQAVELVSSLLGHDLVLDRAADVDSVGFLSSAIVAAREQGRRQATEGRAMLSVAADLTDDEAAELKARFQQAMQHPAVMTVLPEAVDIRRREWGLQWVPVPGHPSDHPDHIAVFHEESEAREAEPEWRAHRLVSRLVGPWEPAEQHEAFDMERLAQLSISYADALEAFQHGDPARSAAALIAAAVLLHQALGEFLNGVRRGRAEPASGGVVEPSGPLTAEEATPDCVVKAP